MFRWQAGCSWQYYASLFVRPSLPTGSKQTKRRFPAVADFCRRPVCSWTLGWIRRWHWSGRWTSLLSWFCLPAAGLLIFAGATPERSGCLHVPIRVLCRPRFPYCAGGLGGAGVFLYSCRSSSKRRGWTWHVLGRFPHFSMCCVRLRHPISVSANPLGW